jgi:hypothetical protein
VWSTPANALPVDHNAKSQAHQQTIADDAARQIATAIPDTHFILIQTSLKSYNFMQCVSQKKSRAGSPGRVGEKKRLTQSGVDAR